MYRPDLDRPPHNHHHRRHNHPLYHLHHHRHRYEEIKVRWGLNQSSLSSRLLLQGLLPAQYNYSSTKLEPLHTTQFLTDQLTATQRRFCAS